jgi:ASC-1-like (ASCH) protein
VAIHLAVMHEPYLARVLAGEKTIESRFLRVRAAPYDRVAPGDRIWLKRAGGPIVAVARVGAVRQYADLSPGQVVALIDQFRDQLCLDEDFARKARGCRYAVLIWLSDVHVLAAPVPYPRRDRRGWVVVDIGRSDGDP